MKYQTLFSIVACVFLFSSCGALKKPIITKYESIDNYKYVYIPATKELTSSTGGSSGNRYGVYGYSVTKSVNPSDVISGYLIKQGYIIIPEIQTENLHETMIVNYGETGRRSLNLGYTIEITLQFIAADTHKVLCTCTAEGQGSTEADDIREAITRALDGLYSKKQ